MTMLKLSGLLCAVMFLVMVIYGRGEAPIGPAAHRELAAASRSDSTPAARPALAEATTAPGLIATAANAAETPAAAVTPVAEITAEAAPSPEARPGTVSMDVTGAKTITLDPAPDAENTELASAPLPEAMVTGSRVNLRASPSSRGSVIDQVVGGERVALVGAPEAGWQKIRMEGDGGEGYIYSRYLRPVSAD